MWVISLITVNGIPFTIFIWCFLTVWGWKILPSFQQLQPMHFSLVLLILNVLGELMSDGCDCSQTVPKGLRQNCTLLSILEISPQSSLPWHISHSWVCI